MRADDVGAVAVVHAYDGYLFRDGFEAASVEKWSGALP